MTRTAVLILALLLTPNSTSTASSVVSSLERVLDRSHETRSRMKNLGTCARRLMSRVAQKRVALFWESNSVEHAILMSVLLEELPCDVSLHAGYNVTTPTHERVLRGQVVEAIVFMQDLSQLDRLARIVNHVDVDRKEKIVVCLTLDGWDEELLMRLVQFLWDLKVANGLLMVQNEDNKVQLFSYWPMRPISCKPTSVRCLVCDCNEIDFKVEDIFTRKMMNMNKCPIRASTVSVGGAVIVYKEGLTYKVKGYEGDLFQAIAGAMNFEPVILPPTPDLWGDESPNGTWSGIHGDVQTGVADIGFCEILPVPQRLHFEEYSQPFTVDRHLWIVPEAQPIGWKKLWLPYQSLAWFTFLTAALLVLVYLVGESYLFHQPLLLCTFITWKILVGQRVSWRGMRIGTKIVMFAWLYFCFIFVNAYLSDLFSYLAASVKPTNYESTRELLENGVPLGGLGTLRYLFDNEDPDDAEIYQKYEVIESSSVFIRLHAVIVDKLRFATIATRTALPYKNDYNFHIMKESVLTYPVVFAFPRGSPYIEEFNRKILCLNQAGLPDHWIRRNVSGTFRRKVTFPKPLKLVNVISVFLLWLICVAFAIVVLCCEMLIWLKYKHKREYQ